jgi:hypothetical protein
MGFECVDEENATGLALEGRQRSQVRPFDRAYIEGHVARVDPSASDTSLRGDGVEELQHDALAGASGGAHVENARLSRMGVKDLPKLGLRGGSSDEGAMSEGARQVANGLVTSRHGPDCI